MADADKRVQVRIDGNAEGIIAAMQQAENAVQTQTRAISGHFSTLSGSINKVLGIVGTMSAVLAGGTMFKEFIADSQAWTGETLKLAKALGTTTEEAGAWKVAAHSLGVEQDVLEGASMKLSRTLATNQDSFNRLGIEVKDTRTGALLPMTTILQNTVERLNELKPGVDRNSAASLLFGRSWKDMQGILKLTNEAIAEGKKELQSLGLEVGPERVQQFVQYRQETKYLGLVMEALKVQIGNSLMPALISFGGWLHDIGPAALTIFGGALKGVVTFVEYASLGVTVLWETWKAFWGQFSTTSISLVNIITQIIQGDFAGAWKTAKQGVADFGSYGVQWFDNIEAASKRTNDRVAKMWGLTAQTAAKSAPQKGENFDPDKTEEDKGLAGRQMAQEDARLKAILAGIKAREAALKEANQQTILEEEHYYKIGMVGQTQFDEKKYEIERQGLIKTKALINEEIKAIEDAEVKKLAIAQTSEEKGKIKSDSSRQISEKVAERQKLNSDLYQLDLRYFTDTRVLALTQQWDAQNARAVWLQKNSASDDAALQKEKEFYGMVAAASGSSLGSQLANIDKEEKAWIQSWAYETSSFEEHERRKTAIESYYAGQRLKANQDEQARKLSIVRSGFSSAATLADAFYQLSGKKSKEAFRAYQLAKSGETIITTADSVQKAFDDGCKINYWVGLAYAAGAATLGATQLATIWSASADGGGSNASSAAGVSAASSAGSSASSTLSDSVVTQSSTWQQAKQQGNITINIAGHLIGEDSWVENNLIPALNSAGSRNVKINYAAG